MADWPIFSAVVDSSDCLAVVWWVHLGAPIKGLKSRQTGAWTLDRSNTGEIRQLLDNRTFVATTEGLELLDAAKPRGSRQIDVHQTWLGLLQQMSIMRAIFDDNQNTRPPGSRLVEPIWPQIPQTFDCPLVEPRNEETQFGRVLRLSIWLSMLAEHWSSLEFLRLERPVFNSLGPNREQPMPLVLVP